MPSKEQLTFESHTPSFLRRLRGETAASESASDPHRHATPQVRARKPRNAAEDEDDAPVYVDAVTGDVIAGEDVEGLKGGGDGDGDGKGDVAATVGGAASSGQGLGVGESHETRAKEVVAAVGTGMGRRKGTGPKVVGEVDEGNDAEDDQIKTKVTAKRKATSESGPGTSKESQGKVKKKTGKKMKLSFDDDG